MAAPAKVGRCLFCNDPLPPGGRGRPAVYCSRRCGERSADAADRLAELRRHLSGWLKLAHGPSLEPHERDRYAATAARIAGEIGELEAVVARRRALDERRRERP